MENLLRGISTKDPSPIGLQTSCSHFTPDEDPGGGSRSLYISALWWVLLWTILDRSLSHLEKPGSTMRIMFFDFSSASTLYSLQVGLDQKGSGPWAQILGWPPRIQTGTHTSVSPYKHSAVVCRR